MIANFISQHADRDQHGGPGSGGEGRLGPARHAHHPASHDNDLKGVQFFIDKSVEVLKAAGATPVWADTVNDSKGGAHARGTCRMGNDPKHHRW